MHQTIGSPPKRGNLHLAPRAVGVVSHAIANARRSRPWSSARRSCEAPSSFKEENAMKSIFSALIAVILVATATLAESADQKKQDDRLRNAGQVMDEVLKMPDTIPQRVLDRTKCVVVIPSVLKAAFVVGGAYGRGAMVCRSGEDFTGPWGAPAMYALE